MLKRSICMLLVLAMMVSFVPLPAGAQEAGTAAPNSEVTLEGDNSFGNLLANTVEESQNEGGSADFDARICDMTVEGTIATVEYTTPVAANLVVAIYTEDGTAMLGSGVAAVSPEETIAEVEIEIAQMPYYFSAGAFLLDGETNDPLSAEFKTDRYTKNMQDILSATVDDFNPELVLNLDDDKTTNFAVFNENTLLAKPGEGVNQITDNGDGTYTIANADEQFRSMQEGDVFAYTYPDGNVLIVSAADVTVEGDTVTVTDNPDAELSDVFDFVKIEEDSHDKEYSYDDSTLSEGLTVISDEEFAQGQEEMAGYAVDIDKKGSIKTNFKISHRLAGTDSDNVSLSGKIAVGLTLNLKVYLSLKYQYISFSLDHSISGSVALEKKVELLSLPLGDFDIALCAGVYAHVSPRFLVEASCSLTYTIDWKGSKGMAFDSDVGWQDISSPSSVENALTIDGKLFVGLEVKLGVAVMSKRAMDLSLTAKAGFELTAFKLDILEDFFTPSRSEIHDCWVCSEGEIDKVISLSLDLEIFGDFFKEKWTIAEKKVKLSDTYYCQDYLEWGLSKCPHKLYKTTITVTSTLDEPLEGVSLQLSQDGSSLDTVTMLDADGNRYTGEVPPTSEKGKSVFYLPNGEYELTVDHNGVQKSKTFTVRKETKDVKLELDTPTAPDIPTVPDTPADACGDNLTCYLDDQGTLTISGTGDMYDFFDIDAPWFERRDEIGSVIIHNGVTSIGDNAFSFCSSLTDITIPDSVTFIGVSAFSGCSSLNSVTIPNSVTSIGQGAFSYCSGLTSVNIPCGVTAIEDSVFNNCSNLTSVTIPDSVTSIKSGAFEGNQKLTDVYYSGTEAEWKQISIEANNEPLINANIHYNVSGEEIASGECGDNLTWKLDSRGKLTISGTGDMYDYLYIDAPWYGRREEIGSVIIHDGVTSIGHGAFYECSSLTSVTIPDSVTFIGSSAFSGCSRLTSVNIPYGVTSIEDDVFYECSNLTSVTIPDSVTSIGYGAFYECSRLTSITIPDSVTFIDSSAFSGCSRLTSVNIPYGVTRICVGTFQGCSRLTSITIPDRVTTIDNDAFAECSSLTSVTIPDSVTYIGYGAFIGCGITSVYIPHGVTVIEDYVFKDCSDLTSVSIPDSVTSIGYGAFSGNSKLKTVLYSGTMEKWTQTTIDDSNEALEKAEIHCDDGIIYPTVIVMDANDSAMLGEMPEEPTPAPATEAPTEPATEAAPIDPTEEAPGAETEAALTADALSNIQWSILPEGAKRTDLLTARPLSAFTGTESNKGSLRSVKFTGLEPQEEYVLIVSLIPGSLAAKDLMYIDQDNAASDGTLRFTYTPREDVNAIVQLYGIPADRKITLDREYLTMAQGDDAQKISAVVTPQEWAGELCWSAENPEDTEVISVDQFGEVTPLNPGTAYAVASVTHGKYTFSARCRVDVTEEQTNQNVLGVQLGTDKVTTELFSTQYASFDAVLLLEQNMVSLFSLLPMEAPEDNGVAIESARFEDETTAKYFHLAVKDDRTLLVVPTEEAIQNPKSVAGSYTSKVIVTVCGTEHTADTALKLTVKKTMPKLKAGALTFNPFFTNQSQGISITGATVTSISRGEDTSKAAALPSWLILDKGVLTLTDDAPRSGSGKVNLLIDTEEWAIPIPLTLSVKLSYKAPGLKLSASSVTIPTFAAQDDSGCLGGGVEFQLLCKDKKQTLESLGVSYLEAPEGWRIHNGDLLTQGSLYMAVQPGTTVRSGKVVLKVHFHGTDSVLELPLTIKAKQTPLKVRVPDHLNKNVKLNSMTEDGFFVSWWVAPQYLDLSKYELAWQIFDKRGNIVTDLFKTGLFKDLWEGYEEDESLAILTTNSTLPGSYTLHLNLRNKETGVIRTEEPTVIKFTVLSKTTKPGISFKAANTIDFAFPNPHTPLNVSFKNFYIASTGNLEFTVTNSKKQDVTDRFELYHDDSVGAWVLRPVAEVPNGSYVMSGKASLRGDVAADFSTKITVKRTPIKLKLSKASLTLNASIHDRATVDVTCNTKGYILGTPVLPEMDALDLSYSSGKLTVAANANTQYGVTYKIPIRVTDMDPAVTLSVKIPAQNKSTVSASLKAKGVIDPIRDGSSVVITPSYKNYAGEAELAKTVTIWGSQNGKNYNLDVTNQFQITENDDGTFTITKVPGAALDASLKYRVILSFPGISSSVPAFTALTVKSGQVSVKTSGTSVLYKKDRFSRGNVSLIIADNTLNPLERVEFKDAKQAALYEVYYYGNGSLAIGFRESSVQNGKYPTSVSLNLFFTGNSSQKPNAAITVKIQIR